MNADALNADARAPAADARDGDGGPSAPAASPESDSGAKDRAGLTPHDTSGEGRETRGEGTDGSGEAAHGSPGEGADTALEGEDSHRERPRDGRLAVATYMRANPQVFVLLVICLVLGLGTFLAVVFGLLTAGSGQTTGEPSGAILGTHVVTVATPAWLMS